MTMWDKRFGLQVAKGQSQEGLAPCQSSPREPDQVRTSLVSVRACIFTISLSRLPSGKPSLHACFILLQRVAIFYSLQFLELQKNHSTADKQPIQIMRCWCWKGELTGGRVMPAVITHMNIFGHEHACCGYFRNQVCTLGVLLHSLLPKVPVSAVARSLFYLL